MTSRNVLYGKYSEHGSKLSHIQAYRAIFTSCSYIFSHIVPYLKPCVTFAYSGPSHIQNSGILRTRDISRTLSRHILECSERFVTLEYWEPYHIQNFISNTRLKLAKNKQMLTRMSNILDAKQHPETELLLFENCSHSSSMLSSKNNITYSRK